MRFCSKLRYYSTIMKRLTLIVLSLLTVVNLLAQPPDELAEYNEPASRLRGVIEKFGEDVGILNRFYTAQTSPNRIARCRSRR